MADMGVNLYGIELFKKKKEMPMRCVFTPFYCSRYNVTCYYVAAFIVQQTCMAGLVPAIFVLTYILPVDTPSNEYEIYKLTPALLLLI